MGERVKSQEPCVASIGKLVQIHPARAECRYPVITATGRSVSISKRVRFPAVIAGLRSRVPLPFAVRAVEGVILSLASLVPFSPQLIIMLSLRLPSCLPVLLSLSLLPLAAHGCA